jgi:hypothetical protein
MPNTFTLIQAVTVGAGGAASIDFTSIPNTYTDLQVVLSVRSGASFTRRVPTLTVNGSSANDYRDLYLLGNGSSASSAQDVPPQPNMLIWDAPAANATANTFSNIGVYIPNYASTTTYKSISSDGVTEDNAAANTMAFVAALYMQNTAISRLTFVVQGNFVQHSTAYLYGIVKS